MAEIAEMIGVSRQRVAQLIESYEDFPKPEVELTGGRVWSRTAVETWIASNPEREPGRREPAGRIRHFFGRDSGALFERFTDRARSSVVKAQEEARLMSHNYLGTEHLLLGLVAIEEGLAFEVLDSLGVSLDLVRTAVEHMIGRGKSTPQGHIPFTPRAKKVLELALREALQLGHNYVGTEHVLLGLVREREGVAWKALESLGLKHKSTRDAVLARLQQFALEKPVAGKYPGTDRCSFCGKTRQDVERLVAGPGVSICNQCVALSQEIIDDEKSEPSSRPADVESRVAQLEQRIAKLERDD